MRVGYSEDEEYPGQFALWQANCRRSRRGRKGREALREMEAALLAMPAKRIGADILVEPDGETCAIGALMLKRKLDAGMARSAAVAELAELDPEQVEDYAVKPSACRASWRGLSPSRTTRNTARGTKPETPRRGRTPFAAATRLRRPRPATSASSRGCARS